MTRQLDRLDGLCNFRDVGGLSTTDGDKIRTGRLFRSGSPQDLTADGVRTLLQDAGIRYVVDLRTAAEAVQQGRGLLGDAPVCYLNVPLVDVDSPAAPPGEIVLRQYLDHLESDPNLPLALDVLAGAVAHPTLMHCAAGKDRTGVVAVLIELLLGVREQDVAEEYMRTAAQMDAIVAQLRGWPRYAHNIDTLPAEIYRCEEHVVLGLLEEINGRYGGALGWARQRGVDEHTVRLLRERLLVGR